MNQIFFYGASEGQSLLPMKCFMPDSEQAGKKMFSWKSSLQWNAPILKPHFSVLWVYVCVFSLGMSVSLNS